MKTAGIREVKNSLSQYIRLVSQGETVLVTDRGDVVAQLAPPPTYANPSQGSDREVLDRLARSGRLRLARQGPRRSIDLPTPSTPIDLGAILRRVRQERA